MAGEIKFPQKRVMELPERLADCERYFRLMFPQGFLGGKGQSMRKFNGRMGKRCMITEKQIYGEETISFSHYKDVVYPEFIMKDNLDEYSTIHILKSDAINRRRESFEYIGGVPLDIDVHKEGVGVETTVSETLEKIMKAIESGLIPMPTIIIHTGRGLAMHYRYLVLVSASEWKVHHRLWDVICQKVVEICGSDICTIDKSVGDFSRVMRIPGTYNSKGKDFCYILKAGPYYEMEELASGFDIDLSSIREEITAEEQAVRGKKERHHSMHTEASEKGQREKRLTREALIHFAPGVIPADDDTDRWIKSRYVEYIERLMAIRDDWTGTRELCCHLYYNFCCFLYTLETAEDMLWRLYEELSVRGEADDFCEDEVDNIINQIYADDGGINLYNYRKMETFVDLLQITEEEMEILHIGGGMEAKEAAAQAYKNNELRDAKRNMIKELFREGYKQKEISPIVNDKLGLWGTMLECKYDYVKKYTSGYRKKDKYLIDKNEKTAYVRTQKKCSLSLTHSETRERGVCGTVCSSKNQPSFGYDVPEHTAKELHSNGKAVFIPKENPIPISPLSVDDAYREYEAGKNLTVLGKAGVGKSMLISKIRKDCNDKGRKISVCAPFGIASGNISGSTVFSTFGMRRMVYPQGHIVTVAEVLRLPIQLSDVLIIDEIGTLRSDQGLYILKVIKKMEEIHHKKVQVIWMGDFLQLPPVCTKEDRRLLHEYGYKSEWLFDLPEWVEMMGTKITLTQSFRHKDDSEAERLMDSIMVNHDPVHTVKELNTLVSHGRYDGAIYLVPYRKQADLINRNHAEEFKRRKAYQVIDQNEQKTIELAKGMRVMTTRNSRTYKNGSLGTIERLNKKSISILLDDKRLIQVTPDANGCYPITYGWAITVHKSQGLTFDHINLVRGFFAEAQLYVAVSRCRTLKGIHLVDGDITVDDIKVCQKAYDFQYGDLVKEMEIPAEPEVEIELEIEPEGEEEELMM